MDTTVLGHRYLNHFLNQYPSQCPMVVQMRAGLRFPSITERRHTGSQILRRGDGTSYTSNILETEEGLGMVRLNHIKISISISKIKDMATDRIVAGEILGVEEEVDVGILASDVENMKTAVRLFIFDKGVVILQLC